MKVIKREVFGKIVKIYDFFGLVLLIILEGKFFYREVCEV